MDKYEYKLRSDEILKLIEEEKYVEAVNIADAIDWRRVKSLTMLLRIAALYRVNRRNEDSKGILMLAYDRYPTNRSVVYSLCEVSIELDDVVAAIEFYKEFVKLAPRDNGVFTLRYRILEAQEASLEERIELLEELKKRDYQEEWAYELAYLYHRVGLGTKCVEECDDLILWFGDGPYVMKAMELKMLHAPLTAIQEKKYMLMQSAAKNIPEDVEYAENENYEGQYYTESEYASGDEEGQYYTEPEYVGEAEEDQYYTESEYVGETEEDQYYTEPEYVGEVVEDQYYTEPEYENEQHYVGVTYTDDSEYEQRSSLSNVYQNEQPTYMETDMSQYNTINLQKVVAESMRELFPDDEDMYAENREDIAAIEKELEKEKSGKIAQMTAGVSEIAPEPQAGAVKKVIVPGQDAHFIQSDTDIEELRNSDEISEENTSFEEELKTEYSMHELPEYSEALQEEHIPFKPITGQMNIQDVLVEWERMKKENEEKRKESVRQLVLQQTGQLFKDFDDSINSGILGELSQEENDIDNEIEISEESENTVEDLTFRTETLLEENDDLSDDNYVNEYEEAYYNEVDSESGEEVDSEAVYEEMSAAFTEDDEVEEVEEVEELEELEELEEDDEAVVLAEEEMTIMSSSVSKPRIIMPAQTDNSFAANPGKPHIVIKNVNEALEEEPILKTQEISMNTEEISSLPERIIAATTKETKGVKKEQIRQFTQEEHDMFEDFAVTKKIRKQIIHALDEMTLASYTGNVMITGEPGLGTLRLAKNLIRQYQKADNDFSGKVAKITGEQLNLRDMEVTFDKLSNGALIIEEANGLNEQTLYDMANLLNQDDFGLLVFMTDTKKGISKLLEKQAMISDYFTLRIDLMEMDNNALVAYAKNYALALEYSIDELGTLALYTRIANIQTGNHIVTKDEVRDIVDEAIWKSKKFKIKNFVDVLFSKRYDQEDMIVLKERDFI